jgi:hypothetical protein
MASISSNTKHKMAAPAPAPKKVAKAPGIGMGKKPAGKKAAKRGAVPPLKPAEFSSASSIAGLIGLDRESQKSRIIDLCRKAMGGTALLDKSKPHTASTTRDRGAASADIAIAAKELGVTFVLKDCDVMNEMQRMLFPEGIQSSFQDDNEGGGGLKPSASAVSLVSLGETTVTSATTTGTDSKRGKPTPANAREGSLLLIRAFCECLGRQAEPYMVGAFLAAALDECGSSSSSVREAAEDTATALVSLANPWAFPCLISPLLLNSLKSNEWRVKSNALDRLTQCTSTSPVQVCRLLPMLIPHICPQVFDTKAQVTKAASSALLAICKTNTNPDIKPAIPALVNAMCKPADTNKAIEKLMGTTFVVSVDAPSLSILCPVLSRALKEKLAIHKRNACVVISNMSKLVSSPEDVAPFGPLLVPELKKVASSVQFEEIRDEALRALATLTKALGALDASLDETAESEAAKMVQEAAKVKKEQDKIEAERLAAEKRDEEIRLKEEEEKKKFKEAMDAQRELNKLEAEAAENAKQEEILRKDKEKRSIKGAGGKCQGCGLKKCKATCLFNGK